MRSVRLGWVLLVLVGCVSTDQQVVPVDEQEVASRAIELGVAYLRQGDYTRAKDNLMKALAIDEDSARAHNTLAIVFQQEREFELAERYFLRAISLDPALIAARNNYGAFLYARARPAEAVTQLQIATEDRFYERRAQAFENLGVAYLALADQGLALAAFERAAALNARLPRTLLELADLNFQQQDYPSARDYFLRHKALAPDSARSLYLCTQIYTIFLAVRERDQCTEDLMRIFPASEGAKTLREGSPIEAHNE